LYIDSPDPRKLKFLIDTGAEISIIRSSSLIPGVEYDWHKRMEIKGISNTVMKTLGKIKLKLFTDTHETTHTFHVLGGKFDTHCDAILGKEFLEERKSVINYCSRQIVMDKNVIRFDPKLGTTEKEPCCLTLKARSQHTINVPTHSEGLGLLSVEEILPGVYLASSLIRAEIGICTTSVINMNETNMPIALPLVTLDVLYTGESALTLTASADFSGSSRLSNLHNHLRLGHLNSKERKFLLYLYVRNLVTYFIYLMINLHVPQQLNTESLLRRWILTEQLM
jgi:hypothetical protein